MANITETISYDSGVYLIATTDPVQGGAGGIANMAAQNLANRTAYLKQHVDNLESGATIPSTVAPRNSPVFTGDPQAPTPALGDNDTSIATTAFVQGTIGGLLNKNVAGSANVTLSAVEAGNGLLNFTGALTGNISVIVPTSPTRQWTVMNNTTGAYTLTVKTASGAGVVVTQGKNVEIFTEGANVVLSTSDFASAAMAASTIGYTQAKFDASTKLATTAFVQSALGNFAGFVSYSGAQTITIAQSGFLIGFASTTGNATYTLPAATGNAGLTYTFTNYSAYVLTLSSSAGVFTRGGGGLTFTVPSGSGVVLASDGVNWEVLHGDAALPYSAIMTGANFTTAPQFDNSTKLATTAFVKQALGSAAGFSSAYNNITATTNLSVGDIGKVLAIGGASAQTIMLPSTAGLPDGTSITLYSQNPVSGAVYTVSAQSGQVIVITTAFAQTAALYPGDIIKLTVGGGNWLMSSGASLTSLSRMSAFAASLAASGYQKLPSGLIIQWGSGGGTGTGAYGVNFPIAFPNGVFSITATFRDITSGTGNAPVIVIPSGNRSVTGCVLAISAQSTIGGFSVEYVAIGY